MFRSPPPKFSSGMLKLLGADPDPNTEQVNHNSLAASLTPEPSLDIHHECSSDSQSIHLHFDDQCGTPTSDDDHSLEALGKKHIKNINQLTTNIVSKLKEGRSLTKANKESIILITNEINQEANSFCKLLSGKSMPASNTEIELAQITKNTNKITDEIVKLKSSIEFLKSRESCSHGQVTPITDPPPAPREISRIVHDPLPFKPTPFKPAIIVSTDRQVNSAIDTLQLWQESIKFTDTNFAPLSTKLLNNNRIRVTFENSEHQKVALDKVNNTDRDIKAEICHKLKPMIIIKGISKNIPVNDLHQIICTQNDTIQIQHPDDFQFKFERINRNARLYNAIFTTSPTTFNKLMAMGKVNINHQRVHVDVYVPLLQCYKCMQFGHTRKRCTNDVTACSYCAESSHTYANCPHKEDTSKLKCFNCSTKTPLQGARRLPNNETHAHSATSGLCPIYQRNFNNTKNKTDYGL